MISDARRERNAQIKRLKAMGWSVEESPDGIRWAPVLNGISMRECTSCRRAWDLAMQLQAEWAKEVTGGTP